MLINVGQNEIHRCCNSVGRSDFWFHASHPKVGFCYVENFHMVDWHSSLHHVVNQIIDLIFVSGITIVQPVFEIFCGSINQILQSFHCLIGYKVK